MTERRTYLEQVANQLKRNTDTKLWKLEKNLNLSNQTYVVESEPGKKFLTQRGSWGRKKFDLIRAVAKSLISSVEGEIDLTDSPREFLILRGAYPFDLQNHSEAFLGNELLPLSRTKLQRVLRSGRWKIEEEFFYGSWSGNSWLIPETAIASGSTISYLLEKGFKTREEPPSKVILFTAAGSKEGVAKINELCDQYGVELISIFSQAIIQVSKQGNLSDLPYTDLPIENKETITSENFYRKAHRIFQGTKMCTIGDIGDSLRKPKDYLTDTLRELKVLDMDINDESWNWVRTIWINDLKGIKTKVERDYPQVATYIQSELRI